MPTLRVACLVPGCPGYAVHRGRCAAHRQTTRERGYSGAHQQAREGLRRTLPSPCGYCGRLLRPGDAWVAAHLVDGQPQYGWMIACPACNERAKGRYEGGRADDWPLSRSQMTRAPLFAPTTVRSDG